MTKYLVLFMLVLSTKAFSQSDSSMRIHVRNAFTTHTEDYVLGHTKLEKIEKEKHIPKQKYMKLRAVYDTATKSYKPVFEEYAIRVGETLRGFKGEFYYSETYKAFLFPVREAKEENDLAANDPNAAQRKEARKKVLTQVGTIVVQKLTERLASQRYANPIYISGY